MIGSSSLFFLLLILLLYCSQIGNCLIFDDQLNDILKENLSSSMKGIHIMSGGHSGFLSIVGLS